MLCEMSLKLEVVGFALAMDQRGRECCDGHRPTFSQWVACPSMKSNQGAPSGAAGCPRRTWKEIQRGAGGERKKSQGRVEETG